MRNSVHIGTIAGVPIRVHWTFGLLVAFFVALTAGSGVAMVAAALGWLALLFGSVVFHELAHSVVARHRGIAVRDIVLLPIGGVSEIPDLGRTPADEFAISIAGPLSSVLLAVGFGLVAALAGASLWPPALMAGSILVRMAWVNLLLAAFNLLPALPLDGGRVLRSSLARHRGEPAATELAATVGQFFALAMVAVGLLIDVWLVLIGVFVLIGPRRRGAGGRPQGGPRRSAGGRPDGRRGHRPARQRHRGRRPGYVGGRARRRHGSGRGLGYIGMVYPADLSRAPAGAHLDEVADRRAPLLDPAMPLFPQAWEAFGTSHRPVLAVGTDGQVRGVISLDDVQRTLRRAVSQGH